MSKYNKSRTENVNIEVDVCPSMSIEVMVQLGRRRNASILFFDQIKCPFECKHPLPLTSNSKEQIKVYSCNVS